MARRLDGGEWLIGGGGVMEEGGSSRVDGSRAGESDGAASADSGSSSSWKPSGKAFRPYVPPPLSSTGATSVKPGMLRIIVRKPVRFPLQ